MCIDAQIGGIGSETAEWNREQQQHRATQGQGAGGGLASTLWHQQSIKDRFAPEIATSPQRACRGTLSHASGGPPAARAASGLVVPLLGCLCCLALRRRDTRGKPTTRAGEQQRHSRGIRAPLLPVIKLRTQLPMQRCFWPSSEGRRAADGCGLCSRQCEPAHLVPAHLDRAVHQAHAHRRDAQHLQRREWKAKVRTAAATAVPAGKHTAARLAATRWGGRSPCTRRDVGSVLYTLASEEVPL